MGHLHHLHHLHHLQHAGFWKSRCCAVVEAPPRPTTHAHHAPLCCSHLLQRRRSHLEAEMLCVPDATTLLPSSVVARTSNASLVPNATGDR